jgi:signal transduction histidine kinase
VICDNGPGIPRSLRDQIFEPFFTTKQNKGSGLGLWVTRSIVHKHHGDVRLRTSNSHGASGTIFRIILPMNASFEAQAA